jgi:glycosyltransferase involved in cell wall biosynthesis
VHIDEEPYNLATFLAARAARRCGIPSLFFTWQNINRSYPMPFRAMERAVYRWSAHALAGSAEAAGVLGEKGFGKPITVVPQFGVDPEVFLPGPRHDGPFTAGFLNRLIPAKAPLLALDAVAALEDVHLKVVGDGPLRDEVRSAIRKRGLEQRVSLRSRVPSAEVPALLRDLDVVVLPSVSTPSWKEQFGRVLVEAMACGIPVVGSSSGEIPHVIGDAGIVVPEGDAAALADAISRLRADADLWRQLSERGRARVLGRFTHARVAARTRDAYLQALESASAG